MKRMIGSVAMLLLAAAVTFAPKANAQCVTGTGTNILLKWDGNGFTYETGTNNPLGALANPINNISPAGNTLHAVMGVSLFCGPLAGLDPNDAANEYTVVWTGLTSGGTATSAFGTSGTKYTTVYLGGTWKLYKGAIDARNYANVSPPAPSVAWPQYNESLVLLSGPIDSLVVTVTKSSLGNINGSFRGQYRVIIDKRATTEERVATLGTALARIDTTALKLTPAVRELLDFYSDRSKPRPVAPAPALRRAS